MAKKITQQEAATEMAYVIGVVDTVRWPGLFLLRDEGALRVMSGPNESRGYPAGKPEYELWDESDLEGEGLLRSNNANVTGLAPRQDNK